MDCLFCKMVSGEIPVSFLYEDEHVAAFADINPQAPYHSLIIPKQHIATINDVDPNSGIMGHILNAAQIITKEQAVNESGYRLVFNCNPEGGQEVYHIHLHVLGGRQMNWPPG